MSLDRSLKTSGLLIRHRNVLKRDERIAKLKDQDRWEDGDALFGLPKVANRKVNISGKAEKTAEEAAAAVPGAAPAAGTTPAAGTAAGKAPAGTAAKAPAATGKTPAAPAKGAPAKK